MPSAQVPETFQRIQTMPSQWGRWVESAVGAYLLDGSLTKNIKLYYWRQGNYEVDFVLEWRGQVLGLEVKSGSSATTTGMQAFRDKFAPKRCIW